MSLGVKGETAIRLTSALAALLTGAFAVSSCAGAIPPPSAPPPARSTAIEPALAEIDSYFREQAQADRFSGAVLIARNGRTLFERGYGFADRVAERPIALDTRFNLGSIYKFLTRLAIFQLVESGRLDLEDTVGEIIPDYPNEDVRNRVTVRHLLDMQGGVRDFMTRNYFQRHKGLHTIDDYLALMAHRPLLFEPGSRSDYSNGGYVILGKIIERVSGMSYDDYVRAYITDPAGMSSTSLDPLQPGQDYAIGYTRGMPGEDGARTAPLGPNTAFLPGRGSSANGGYSTVRDFARLAAALLAGRLLGPEARASFFSFWEGYEEGGEPAGWNGGYLGVSTTFAMWSDGTTVVIFTNRDPPLNRVSRERVFALLGKPQG